MIIIISKYFTKMIVEKDKYTFIFKSQFRNLPEIRFQSFKIPFKFTFHGVSPLHKTTFFVATHTGDQLNFIATKLKSFDTSPPPNQAINYDRLLRSGGIRPKFPGSSSVREMSGKNLIVNFYFQRCTLQTL